jgi:hypothetical protein
VIGHTPEAIDAWVRGLAERFAGHWMAVCLERFNGSLIYVLIGCRFCQSTDTMVVLRRNGFPRVPHHMAHEAVA